MSAVRLKRANRCEQALKIDQFSPSRRRRLTGLNELFLDESSEVTPFQYGQLWTPAAGHPPRQLTAAPIVAGRLATGTS